MQFVWLDQLAEGAGDVLCEVITVRSLLALKADGTGLADLLTSLYYLNVSLSPRNLSFCLPSKLSHPRPVQAGRKTPDTLIMKKLGVLTTSSAD